VRDEDGQERQEPQCVEIREEALPGHEVRLS
jgi:hypothetical protein